MKLTSKEKKLIVKSIIEAEHLTSGEIRVHLSYSKSDESPLLQAQNQFEKLKMHLTKNRNGVLLYVNPRVRKFALYGDIGIHEKVGQAYWNALKDALQSKIREKDLTSGITHAVEELGKQLKTYFPHTDHDQNQLSNDVTESN